MRACGTPCSWRYATSCGPALRHVHRLHGDHASLSPENDNVAGTSVGVAQWGAGACVTCTQVSVGVCVARGGCVCT